MSRFGNLDKRATTQPLKDAKPAARDDADTVPAGRAKARVGKRAVIGYFSEELTRELRILSATEGKTIQALLGESIDLLMTDRGRNRFNER